MHVTVSRDAAGRDVSCLDSGPVHRSQDLGTPSAPTRSRSKRTYRARQPPRRTHPVRTIHRSYISMSQHLFLKIPDTSVQRPEVAMPDGSPGCGANAGAGHNPGFALPTRQDATLSRIIGPNSSAFSSLKHNTGPSPFEAAHHCGLCYFLLPGSVSRLLLNRCYSCYACSIPCSVDLLHTKLKTMHSVHPSSSELAVKTLLVQLELGLSRALPSDSHFHLPPGASLSHNCLAAVFCLLLH